VCVGRLRVILAEMEVPPAPHWYTTDVSYGNVLPFEIICFVERDGGKREVDSFKL